MIGENCSGLNLDKVFLAITSKVGAIKINKLYYIKIINFCSSKSILR